VSRAFIINESGYISLDRTIIQGVENYPTNVNVHGQEIVSGGFPRRKSLRNRPEGRRTPARLRVMGGYR
jgi:hypothetical protein